MLTATIDGQDVISGPTAITIDDQYTYFTPIYLASDVASYDANHRYSTHDEAGGDSWGTFSMLSWLLGTEFKYNDISAALAGQTATSHSVLGHAGHSDGQQVDVRYHDGAGGFTEILGGANRGAGINQLASDARAEVLSDSESHPKLDRLVSWINENRAGIAAQCAAAQTRRIYIGNSFIKTLLVSGQFPGSNKTTVPGVTAWPNMPAKILPQNSHLDHWHISTHNP